MSARYSSWLAVAALLTVLSLAMHASLLPRLSSAIAGDLGDPLLNTWILWWNTQQVPFTDAYWNAPAFAPAPDAFALSETLLGLTWLTTPLQWLGASPLIAYNVMLVLTPVLNGLGAFWLCLTLTGRRDASWIGSLAVAFAPYHASQLSHLQMQAMFFMPVALVGMHRYWTAGGWRWLALFGAATTLNGLVCGYFLLYFSVLVAIALVWLILTTRDWLKLGTSVAMLAFAALALSPVIVKYRRVQTDLNLERPIHEIERNSADLGSLMRGSPNLELWSISAPQHQPELAGYPGLAIGLLAITAAFLAFRGRSHDPLTPPWRRLLVRTLTALSLTVSAVGIIVVLTGGVSYKVFGVAIDLGILAALCSLPLTARPRSGSIPTLYGIAAMATMMLALGPVGRVLEHRFWYKPPYSVLLFVPGFDAARVPARFIGIEVLCLGVIAAFAITRIWPISSRRSRAATALIAMAIVADGWMRVPVVAVPKPIPAAVTADLVVELPTRGLSEDVAAMYRGMSHGRPVVNGYSGWEPPAYLKLRADLWNDCVKSLEGLRAGRSMDVVIWRHHEAAATTDAAFRELWSNATREETPDAIVFRHPRSAPETDPARTRCAPANAGRF